MNSYPKLLIRMATFYLIIFLRLIKLHSTIYRTIIMTVYNSSIQPITKKVCSNDATHTTKRWKKDPNDMTRDLCYNCYIAAHTQKKKAEGTVCSNDASHMAKEW